MPGSGLFDNLLALIGNAGQSVGAAATPAPKRAPQAAAAPYAGYLTSQQQQSQAGQQADAGLAPQLAELKRLQAQALQQAQAQGQINTAAADAAANIVKTGPNAGTAYAQQAGLSDAFVQGYQKAFSSQMPGQHGQDAADVLGALTGGAGNLFRTQGAGAANSQDNAVNGIIGRGQLGLIAAQAQGNKAVGDLNTQRLGIMAQRPALYQTALDRIQSSQASLSSAQAKAVQQQIDAAYKRAADYSKSGMVYTVDPSTGQVVQLKDDRGNPVLTSSERGQLALQKARQDQINLTRTALGLKAQNQTFTQNATTARITLDQTRVAQAGRSLAQREAKASADAARRGDQDAYNRAQDKAVQMTKGGTVWTVQQTTNGYATVPAPGPNGKPLQVKGAAKTAKPRFTRVQLKNYTGTAARMAKIAFEGGTDAKGDPIEPMTYEEALSEFDQEGYFSDSVLAKLALQQLGRYYKPGDDRGTPMTAAQRKAADAAARRQAARDIERGVVNSQIAAAGTQPPSPLSGGGSYGTTNPIQGTGSYGTTNPIQGSWGS